ncbi:hypothetical protein Hdeb2414_s0002g00049871 [Helianthus debilis subsp. tardiflorus]
MWARLTVFHISCQENNFIVFSQQLWNRLSKRFILNLFKTNYELAQLYVDFFACSFSGCIFRTKERLE